MQQEAEAAASIKPDILILDFSLFI